MSNEKFAVDLSVLSRESLERIVFDLMQAHKENQTALDETQKQNTEYAEELNDLHEYANNLGEENDSLNDELAEVREERNNALAELETLNDLDSTSFYFMTQLTIIYDKYVEKLNKAEKELETNNSKEVWDYYCSALASYHTIRKVVHEWNEDYSIQYRVESYDNNKANCDQ